MDDVFHYIKYADFGILLLLLLLKHQRGGNAEKGLKPEGLTPKKFNKTSTLSTTRR